MKKKFIVIVFMVARFSCIEAMDTLYVGNVLAHGPLVLAIALNLESLAEVLINSIEDNDDRLTELFRIALNHNRIKIARMLLNKGANIETLNVMGETPLLQALNLAVLNHLSNAMARMLINKGANVNVFDGLYRRDTPLSLATSACDVEMVRLLIAKGAHVNVQQSFFRQPLLCAFDNLDNLGKRVKMQSIVKILIEAGADVNCEDNCDRPPLFYAIKERCTDTAKILIEAGACVNWQDDLFSRSLLLYAIEERCTDIAKILIEAGACVNWHDAYYHSLLYYAVRRPCYEIVKLLLERSHINLEYFNNNNIPYLYLIEHELIEVVRRKDARMISLLINHPGVDINIKDAHSRTPLIWAAASGNSEIVELLIEKGADPLFRAKSFDAFSDEEIIRAKSFDALSDKKINCSSVDPIAIHSKVKLAYEHVPVGNTPEEIAENERLRNRLKDYTERKLIQDQPIVAASATTVRSATSKKRGGHLCNDESNVKLKKIA